MVLSVRPMRDADTKNTRQIDGILESEGIKVKRHTPVSPNLNAQVERFIQSIQQECLDHFIVCGERHFEYLIREYVEHYHAERPRPPHPQGSRRLSVVGSRL